MVSKYFKPVKCYPKLQHIHTYFDIQQYRYSTETRIKDKCNNKIFQASNGNLFNATVTKNSYSTQLPNMMTYVVKLQYTNQVSNTLQSCYAGTFILYGACNNTQDSKRSLELLTLFNKFTTNVIMMQYRAYVLFIAIAALAISNFAIASSSNQINVNFSVSRNGNMSFNAENYTDLVNISIESASTPNAPTGFEKLSIYNISINKSIENYGLNITTGYQCGLSIVHFCLQMIHGCR